MDAAGAGASALWICGGVGFAAALIGWFGRGLAFLIKRWFVGDKHRERLEYISQLADLKIKLRESGLNVEEVEEVAQLLKNPKSKASDKARAVVNEMKEDFQKFDPFDSNVAMKGRAGASYEVANAQLEQALVDLRLVVGEDWPFIERTHEAWLVYRKSLEEWAYQQFEGGTHAPLSMTMAGLSETERRTAEIREEVDYLRSL